MVHPIATGSGAVPPISAVGKAPKRATDMAANTATHSVPTPVLSRMVEELAQQGPPVDFARIAQLRQAIAGGDYAVDRQAVARAIIGFAKAG